MNLAKQSTDYVALKTALYMPFFLEYYCKYFRIYL